MPPQSDAAVPSQVCVLWYVAGDVRFHITAERGKSSDIGDYSGVGTEEHGRRKPMRDVPRGCYPEILVGLSRAKNYRLMYHRQTGVRNSGRFRNMEQARFWRQANRVYWAALKGNPWQGRRRCHINEPCFMDAAFFMPNTQQRFVPQPPHPRRVETHN